MLHRPSKRHGRFLGQAFDYLITVCNRTRDDGPTFAGDNERIHWGYDDPAAATGSLPCSVACATS